MDSREVAAKAPVVDPAKDATRLDKAVENARIGIGFINVLTLSNELVRLGGGRLASGASLAALKA
jgi:hypothetical protein